MRWKSLNCLVTGASSGLGRATSLALARQGASVIAVARREHLLSSLVEALGGPPHLYVVCDVSDLGQVRAMARTVSQRVSHLDVLVNNAGVASAGLFTESTSEQLTHVLTTNLLGPIWCTRELFPLLQAAPRRGRTPVIVNLASMAGRIASPGAADYTASKFGLVGFTEGLWSELAEQEIRLCMVNPGLTQTEGFPLREVLANHAGKHLVMNPDRVARALVRGIERGAFEVRVQWWMHPAYFASVLLGPLRRTIGHRVRRSVGNVASPHGKSRDDVRDRPGKMPFE